MESRLSIPRPRAPLPRQAWIRCAAAAWLMLFTAVGSWAQMKPSEYDVEAAYLFNFGKFMRINVPQAPSATFDICILGRDPIGHTLDDLTANEKIDSRPVRILRLTDAYPARKCQIVFISVYEADAMHADLAALSGAQTLTVSDAPDFLQRGGMIQFILQKDRVRFEVNLDAADRCHVVLSSELLRVAAAVQGKPAGVPR